MSHASCPYEATGAIVKVVASHDDDDQGDDNQR